MFKVNIAQDPHDPKVRWLQTTHDGHAFSLIEFRSDEEALQIVRALQQSVQRTGGESGQQNLFSAGEVLPAKVTRQSTRR